MGQLSDWIVGTPLSRYLQSVHGLVPVTQTLHILSIAILLSSALMIDLRLLGVFAARRPVQDIIRRFAPALWTALAGLAVTGSVLLSVEPGRSLLTYQFQLKMLLLLAAVSITIYILHNAKSRGGVWTLSASIPVPVRTLALISMALWMGIIFAGRWIAYA